MSYYKTYEFSKENFIEAFDRVYGRQVEEKAKKFSQRQTQNNVDSEIADAMKSGMSREDAVMKLFPNG